MKYKVIVKQRLSYTQEIEAEFKTAEEATLYCEVTLNACKNTVVEISLINENEESEEVDND